MAISGASIVITENASFAVLTRWGRQKKLVVVNDSELELTTGRGPDDSQADARQSDDESKI